MTQANKNFLLWGAVLIALLGFVIYYLGVGAPAVSDLTGGPAATSTEPQAGTETAPSEPAAGSPPSQPAYKAPSRQPAIPIIDTSVSIVSPAPGDRWVIGERRNITWSKPFGEIGGIYLFNEDKNEVAGWIASHITAKQITYFWDGRSVFLSRTSPDKKDIDTGKYTVRININGRAGEIVSSPFVMILPTQVTADTYTVTIKDFVFSPNVVSIRKGDKVVFTNKDSVTHRVVSTNLGPYTIPAGESATLDSSFLAPFSYGYYCDLHPQMKPATLVVE